MGVQRHASGPNAFFPGADRQRSVVDHARGLGQEAERFAVPLCGQASNAQHQTLAFHRARGLRAGHRLRQRRAGSFKKRGVARSGGLRGQLQHEVAPFGDAHVLAHQPVGAQLNAQRFGVEPCRHRHRNRQQQCAVVAVVHQRADRQAAWGRPLDVAGRQTGGQRPLQRGGQAGVSRVLPVGVPARLVVDPQAEPQRFACAHAFGRVRQQLGAHLRRADDRARRSRGPQRAQAQGGGEGKRECKRGCERECRPACRRKCRRECRREWAKIGHGSGGGSWAGHSSVQPIIVRRCAAAVCASAQARAGKKRPR